MAGEPVVHIGENSPEYIAYRLFRDVAGLEKKSLAGSDATRAWIPRHVRGMSAGSEESPGETEAT